MASRLDTDGNDMMLNSALHILDREGYIDRFDIPGRRVRGTRLLKPTVMGAQLKLDTAKLREKERRDREKLKIVIDFAYAHVCRQQAILRYFGEVDAEPCGNCDICLETAGPKRAPNDEEALIVRKALSGVARMSTRTTNGWQPKFGRGRIVQTLVGSRSREIIDARLAPTASRIAGRRHACFNGWAISNGYPNESGRNSHERRARLCAALAAAGGEIGKKSEQNEGDAGTGFGAGRYHAL